ncbi:DUF567-domain-containing protein [Stereum hirsutum FP-91666 SS1]|uniref:DUF567-domain-containing protein n=1 Tax=Stereum hirsutum (strain FP-91666) TaxID=721885 RepID=R7RXN7_STEHR|nr:DUF567-domain-containing protein [Stereum hirsutum FP-91666 SS1]EIM79548.1 DUF567-domain-containing protein [Stereum hirsutum FP-91666 SS1]
MGLFGHSTSQSVLLEPFHPPIGLNAAFCMPHVETLVMKEKMWSFSGDDFSIQNSAGQDVVRCHGQAFSWRDRKEFKDARQMPLFTVRNKVLAFHKTQLIEAMDGTDLCTVKKKFSIGSSRMIASFHNLASANASSSSHDLIELECKGDWFDRSAIITLLGTERVVGQISRKILNMREVIGGQQTYAVTIAPGVDVALMAALCVCFDEAFNESQN